MAKAGGGSTTRRLVALGGVLLVALGAAVVVARDGGDSSVPGRSVELGAAVGGVRAIPGFPARYSPATADVRGSLLVFGGSLPGTTRFRNDAVLVAPDGASARRLPGAPFDPPLYAPSAVGVDGRVVVVGTACSVRDTRDTDSDQPACIPGTNAAAVLDARPGRGAWHRITLPSALRGTRAAGGSAIGATSDGRAVFRFPPFRDQTLWSFAPTTGVWEEIEAPSIPFAPDGACLAGDTLVVLRTIPHGPVVEPVVTGRALDRGEPWIEIPRAPYLPGDSAEISCTTGSAIVLDPAFPTSMLECSFASRTWSDLPTTPSRRYLRDRVWTGRELVFLPTEADPGAAGVAYDPARRTWRALTGLPAMTRGARWNGTAIVGYSEPSGPSRAANARAPGSPTAGTGAFRYVLPAS